MSRDLFYRVGVTASAARYDLSSDVGSLTLEERESEPTKLLLELMDPFKVFSYALQDGMELEAELGTADDHELVFRGRIYHVDATFPEAGTPTVSVSAYDGLMAMGLRERNRAFTDQSLSKVVSAVAQPYFSSTSVKVKGDPSFGPEGIRQRDETDLAFLLRLAREFGCEMYVVPTASGAEFKFTAQRIIMDAVPDVTLYHGRCDVAHRLLSFTPTSDVTAIELPRVLSGIDFKSGDPVSVSTVAPDTPPASQDDFVDENLTAFRKRYPEKAGRLETLIAAASAVQKGLRHELGDSVRRAVPTFVSSADLAERRKNQFSTQQLGMQASGSTLGNQHLRAQRSLGLLDVGGRFSGTWFLSQVKHSLTRLGFRTEFECRR
jgi:phage protein D